MGLQLEMEQIENISDKMSKINTINSTDIPPLYFRYKTKPIKSSQAYLLEDVIPIAENMIFQIPEGRNKLLTEAQRKGLVNSDSKELSKLKKVMAKECLSNSLYFSEDFMMLKKIKENLFSLRMITWEI